MDPLNDRKFPFNCPWYDTNACTGLFEQNFFTLSNELNKCALPFINFIDQLNDVFRTVNKFIIQIK